MKKKILAITLCVAMLAIMLVSGTLAYFTDEKEQTNTFSENHAGRSKGKYHSQCRRQSDRSSIR